MHSFKISRTIANAIVFIVHATWITSCSDLPRQNNSHAPTTSANFNPQGELSDTSKSYHVFPQVHAHLKGMVSEFIFEAFEDSNGHFWFCTNHDGVIRYDGNTLMKFTEKNGLGGSAVRSHVMDKNGTIWFGTSGGLTRFDGKSFTNFLPGKNPMDNEIWALALDSTGMIWVGANSGLSRFDGKQFEKFDLPGANIQDARPGISPERVSGIWIDSKSKIWFVTDGYGITLFDSKKYSFLTTANGLTDNQVTSVFEDSQGNMWIGTYGSGVSMYDGKSFMDFTKSGRITGDEISNFCEDQHGNIWFSAENLGVYCYDGTDFRLFTTKDGLTTNTVQHIYIDTKQQIWFFTWQGISLYDGKTIQDVSVKEPWTK